MARKPQRPVLRPGVGAVWKHPSYSAGNWIGCGPRALGGGLQRGLGIEQRLTDVAAGEGGDVGNVARSGQELAQEGFDFVRRRWLDFVDFEPGLEALLEFIQLAVARADHRAAVREIDRKSTRLN